MAETRVVREPMTYRRDAPHSFFIDMILRDQDPAAARRQERHVEEMRVELTARQERADVRRQSAEGPGGDLAGVEYRVNASPASSNFAPPLWLIDLFTTAPRPGRVLARLIAEAGGAFPLPAGAQSVNLPRLSSGDTAETEVPLGGAPGSELRDAAVSSNVATITGDADVPLQMLEQSPRGPHLDYLLFKDLSESYDASLEAALLAGPGGAGQLAGLTAIVPATHVITYTSPSPSATAMTGLLGSLVAVVGNNRKMPPETWLMTTSRGAWFASSEDQQSRPLVLSDVIDEPGVFDLLTYPARPDDALPTTLGTGFNQDTILLCRPTDCVLFESEPRTMVGLEVLSGILCARLQYRGYAAFLVRHPRSVAQMTGSGMVVPAGF